MRIAKYLAALVAVVLVHVAGVSLVPSFSRAVDLFLVLVVLNALGGDSLAGLLGGFAAGLAQDVLTGGLFGLYGFADTIIGYGAARLAQRLVIQRITGLWVVVAFASVLQQAILVALEFLLLPDPSVPDPVWVAIRAGTSGLLGALSFAVGRRWRATADGRRRRRVRRLKLE